MGAAMAAILAIGVYWFGLRGSSTPDAQARPVHPVAQIGGGKTVIVVGDNGALIGNAAGKKSHLPVLPLKSAPKGNRVRGRVLEQVRVLAAAPKICASSSPPPATPRPGSPPPSPPGSKSASATTAKRRASGKPPRRSLPIRP